MSSLHHHKAIRSKDIPLTPLSSSTTTPSSPTPPSNTNPIVHTVPIESHPPSASAASFLPFLSYFRRGNPPSPIPPPPESDQLQAKSRPMKVIWGFNLSEMSWSAFKGSKMFDKRWYLRRERFVIYQIAMLVCLAAECTATYSLAKYQAQQDHIERLSEDAEVHNNDLIAAQCLTIVFCVFVPTLFGADFFFLLFWPARIYPAWYNKTKKGLAVGTTIGLTAATIMSTIVVAAHSAYITGVSAEQAQQYIDIFFRPPLKYNIWAPNIAFVVLLWVGLVATIASTILMFNAARHVELYGADPLWESEIKGAKDTNGRRRTNGTSDTGLV